MAPTPADSRITGASPSARKNVPRGAATSRQITELDVGVDVSAGRPVRFMFDADPVLAGAGPVGQRVVADQRHGRSIGR